MGDNARHRIAVNRTIDGMCLDGGGGAQMQSHRAKGLQTRSESAPRRFHVDGGPVRLQGFCN